MLLKNDHKALFLDCLKCTGHWHLRISHETIHLLTAEARPVCTHSAVSLTGLVDVFGDLQSATSTVQ